MTDASNCLTCMGKGRLMVGMTYPPNKTIAVKFEYDPCPDCTPLPHTFRARRTAQILKERKGTAP